MRKKILILYEKSKKIGMGHYNRCLRLKELLKESNIRVVPESQITSKVWRQMKYDLRDQIDELVKVGEDYAVFQNAQGTAKSLKQIKRILDKIN